MVWYRATARIYDPVKGGYEYRNFRHYEKVRGEELDVNRVVGELGGVLKPAEFGRPKDVSIAVANLETSEANYYSLANLRTVLFRNRFRLQEPSRIAGSILFYDKRAPEQIAESSLSRDDVVLPLVSIRLPHAVQKEISLDQGRKTWAYSVPENGVPTELKVQFSGKKAKRPTVLEVVGTNGTSAYVYPQKDGSFRIRDEYGAVSRFILEPGVRYAFRLSVPDPSVRADISFAKASSRAV